MKICLAQIQPTKGDIDQNIEIHQKWINKAIEKRADIIVFPELSLTSYEPQLAKTLAMDLGDERLKLFQSISEKSRITIAIGAPIQSDNQRVLISMIIFQPSHKPKIYSKQNLHSDEIPYFVSGKKQLLIKADNYLIAPAICYESLQENHAKQAIELGANIYIASVAKPQRGIDKAYLHYPKIAKKYAIPVLMVNSVGFCDNFLSVGQSAIWDPKGEQIGSLGSMEEGLLFFDSEEQAVG